MSLIVHFIWDRCTMSLQADLVCFHGTPNQLIYSLSLCLSSTALESGGGFVMSPNMAESVMVRQFL